MLKIIAKLFLCLTSYCVTTGNAFAETETTTEVIVLSTLHKFHEEIEAYTYDDLSRLIDWIDADVLALELTLQDLQSRKVQGTKQEYQNSVYPLLQEGRFDLVALEPSPPKYTTLVGYMRKAQSDLKERHPEKAEAFNVYTEILYSKLFTRWKSPQEVNSTSTDLLFETKHLFQMRLFGPDEERAWQGWNQHFLDQILLAVEIHPGKKILVLVGAEHSYWLRDQLRQRKNIALIDTQSLVEAWSTSGKQAKE